MEEKYNHIVKEAQELFDSILGDSLLVQNRFLYEEQRQVPISKQNVEICLTNKT